MKELMDKRAEQAAQLSKAVQEIQAKDGSIRNLQMRNARTELQLREAEATIEQLQSARAQDAEERARYEALMNTESQAIQQELACPRIELFRSCPCE